VHTTKKKEKKNYRKEKSRYSDSLFMLQTPPRQHYKSIFSKSDVIALIIDHRFSPEKVHAHKTMSSARSF
jgi:hypothetical protein